VPRLRRGRLSDGSALVRQLVDLRQSPQKFYDFMEGMQSAEGGQLRNQFLRALALC
jgi:hypothetical protein